MDTIATERALDLLQSIDKNLHSLGWCLAVIAAVVLVFAIWYVGKNR